MQNIQGQKKERNNGNLDVPYGSCASWIGRCTLWKLCYLGNIGLRFSKWMGKQVAKEKQGQKSDFWNKW